MHSRRSFLAWTLGAAAAVLWAVGASACLIWQTRGFPGVITMTPGQGGWELIELFSRMPAWRLGLLLSLLIVALTVLLARLARSWDSEGRVREALRWPLRAWRGWLLALVLLGLALWLEHALEFEGSVLVLSMLLPLLTPWWAWSPSQVAGDKPRWMRPVWPGAPAFLLWLGCFLFWVGIGFFERDWEVPWPWAGLEIVLEAALELLLSACVVAVWLRGASRKAVPLRAFFAGPVVREYLWMHLLLGMLVVALLAPWVVAMIQNIFVLPQLDEMSRQQHMALPAALSLQADVTRWLSDKSLFVLAGAGDVYLSLVIGRWFWTRAHTNLGLARSDR